MVACVQTNCAQVQHAHEAYAGACVCGSSGSIRENPNDPNKECSRPSDFAACPNCVYACVHNNQACPHEAAAARRPPPPPAASNTVCRAAEALPAIQTQANALATTGERLRRVTQLQLPEFPELNYCVESSGRSISVRITNDSGGLANSVLNVVRNVETAGGVLSAFEDGSAATGISAIQSLSVTVLGGIRSRIIQHNTTSRGNDPTLEFITSATQMARNVQNLRKRIVCTVKQGLPAFYRDMAALEARVRAVEAQLATPSCAPRAAAIRTALARVMSRARRIHRWHAEGIVRPPGASGGWVLRRTWLDSRVDAGAVPRIFNETTCN